MDIVTISTNISAFSFSVPPVHICACDSVWGTVLLVTTFSGFGWVFLLFFFVVVGLFVCFVGLF